MSSRIAGAAGRQYYVVSLHKPNPVDAQADRADAWQGSAAASDGNLPSSFQAPAGFVLKGGASYSHSLSLQALLHHGVSYGRLGISAVAGYRGSWVNVIAAACKSSN